MNNVDAFTGMVAERHLTGTELGELQLADLEAAVRDLRDGDRFFYGNDPGLGHAPDAYGMDFRRTLGQIIAANTGVQTPVERVPGPAGRGGRVGGRGPVRDR